MCIGCPGILKIITQNPASHTIKNYIGNLYRKSCIQLIADTVDNVSGLVCHIINKVGTYQYTQTASDARCQKMLFLHIFQQVMLVVTPQTYPHSCLAKRGNFFARFP